MCIGCKLANGELPTYTIYEDKELRVILDLYPYSKGHMLILTKEHYEGLVELPQNLAHKIMDLSKTLTETVNRAFNPDSVIVLQNNGAMNSLKHYHYHVVPHYSDSDINTLYDTKVYADNSQERLTEIQETLLKISN